LAVISTVSGGDGGDGVLRRGHGRLDPEAGGSRGARLRRQLVAAGPLAARFAIYLGSRVDLLPGTDCLRLLETPDQAPPSPPGRVAELLARELGSRPEALFEAFDPEPFDSGLLFQWHHARLPGGEAVTVELVHPELEPALDNGGLRYVAERLIGAEGLPVEARGAIDEFAGRLDLRRAAAALEELADEIADSPWVEVPKVHRRLSTERIRVLSALAGRSADSRPAEDAGEAAGETRARRLGRIWLALALGGELCPAEPWGRNLRYLKSGRVAFVDGGVHRLPRASQGDLQEYLAAIAARDPARAAQAFLDLLPDRPTDRRLRDRLRHTDPYRDRSWDVGGDLFVRQVLAHWRTASELGYRLPEGVATFYRGLFLLNQEARRLADDSSSVRDGLREARLLLLFGELRDEAEGGRWAGRLERQLSLMSGLPQKLDRILTLAAEHDRPGSEDRRRDGEREPLRGSGWPAVAGCLLALAAVALLTHHVAEAGTIGVWAERLGALVVFSLGALLLGVTRRAGRG
jgi:ubiquinone biosynthesis protein